MQVAPCENSRRALGRQGRVTAASKFGGEPTDGGLSVRRRAVPVLFALTAAVLVAPVGARSTTGYLAGASKVVVTPPRHGPRVTAVFCPSAVFKGRSMWDFD